MLQTKVIEKIKTHILYSVTLFRKSCRLLDNVGKYNAAQQATRDNITRRMRFACWITKATDTHSEYLILIAFPRLRESVFMLRYMYISSLVYFKTRPPHSMPRLRMRGAIPPLTPYTLHNRLIKQRNNFISVYSCNHFQCDGCKWRSSVNFVQQCRDTTFIA